jgi:hypothetical protein
MPDPSRCAGDTLASRLDGRTVPRRRHGRSTPRRPSALRPDGISRLGSMTASPVRSSSSSSGSRRRSVGPDNLCAPAPPFYRRARAGRLMPISPLVAAGLVPPARGGLSSTPTAANAKHTAGVATRGENIIGIHSVTSSDNLMQGILCQLAAKSGWRHLLDRSYGSRVAIDLMIVVVQDSFKSGAGRPGGGVAWQRDDYGQDHHCGLGLRHYSRRRVSRQPRRPVGQLSPGDPQRQRQPSARLRQASG